MQSKRYLHIYEYGFSVDNIMKTKEKKLKEALKIPRLFKLRPDLAAKLKQASAESRPKTTETAIVEESLDLYFDKNPMKPSKKDEAAGCAAPTINSSMVASHKPNKKSAASLLKQEQSGAEKPETSARRHGSLKA